jgi:hypothetical protein
VKASSASATRRAQAGGAAGVAGAVTRPGG